MAVAQLDRLLRPCSKRRSEPMNRKRQRKKLSLARKTLTGQTMPGHTGFGSSRLQCRSKDLRILCPMREAKTPKNINDLASMREPARKGKVSFAGLCSSGSMRALWQADFRAC
eukprot:5848594-Amphidinium_carterae.1